MSLEALMAVLGHVTPEMTLRYAHLASDTMRDAYDTAIANTRPNTTARRWSHRPVRSRPRRVAPQRVAQDRVAHGFCSRHPAAGACPHANICEQCDNFVPDPNRRGVNR
jgi:hypothetical protein